jgi:hypothetical protein
MVAISVDGSKSLRFSSALRVDNNQKSYIVDNGLILITGKICEHNIIIATLSGVQKYGTGSAAALVNQVKKFSISG